MVDALKTARDWFPEIVSSGSGLFESRYGASDLAMQII